MVYVRINMYSFNLLLIRFALLTISGICLRVCHYGDSSLLAHAAVLCCCFPIDCSCLQLAAYDSGVTQFTWTCLGRAFPGKHNNCALL